jgi:DNA-directed RNA polymerase specialized sigma24 family protein
METYESLIETIQTATGDERHEAFSELMNRFKEAANRWAYMVLEDEHLAQDAAQEAFIAAYDHIMTTSTNCANLRHSPAG